MLGFLTNGRLGWIPVLKNASSSWYTLLLQEGWLTLDLYQSFHETRLDPDQLIWFGLLRDPMVRHSMGVAQYLQEHNLQACLDEPLCHPLLVSGCLDAHSMPITSEIPHRILKRCTWFVIDHPTYDYEELCRNWLRSHGVNLPPVPRINTSSDNKRRLLDRVNQLKQQHTEMRSKLERSLALDLELYLNCLEMQHLYSPQH